MIISYWSPQAFLRVLTFFVASHLGRMIAGSTLLIIGAYNIVSYAPNSHQVSYRQLPTGSYHLLLTMDAKYYVLQGEASHVYYLIDPPNFTPWPDPGKFDNRTVSISSLIYRTDGKTVRLGLEDGSTISGTGYQLVQFTVVGPGGTQTYITPEYRDHPSGFYENDWLGGAIIVGVGLLFFALTLLVYWLDSRPNAGEQKSRIAKKSWMSFPRSQNCGPSGCSNRKASLDLRDMER